MSIWKRAISHIVPITEAEYESDISGMLDIRWEKGRLALNSGNANYSFNALHKVMRHALKRTTISTEPSRKILNLGLGGGSTVEIIREEMGLPNPIISVELDPVVIDIAKNFFEVERFTHHDIVMQDVVHFVNACDELFGLVIIDIFVDEKTPERIRNVKFLRNIASMLLPNGQAIFNTMRVSDADELKESTKSMDLEFEQVRFKGQKNSVFLFSRK